MRKFFCMTALLTSSLLHAQDSTSLENITLTASKFSIKTNETGKVVTIISRQEIDQAGSRDLAQVITEFGGVFINGYGNPGKDKNIYLRGARPDHTLITIDGIPVYDASGIGSNFDIRNIPIDNVERIEILKGSQGTLYGSDAIGGVINIITRKSSNDPITLSGNFHYGSFETWKTGISVGGKKGKFDYQAGYSYFNTGGFTEAVKPEGSSVNYDRDPFKQHNFHLSIGIQPTNSLHIQPFFRFNSTRGSVDQDAFIDETDYTYDSENWHTGIRNQVSLGKTKLNVSYLLNKTKRYYLDDTSGTRNGYFIFSESQLKATEHFVESFIVHSFPGIKLTAGADLRSSGSDVWSTAITAFSPVPEYSEQSSDSIHHNQVGTYAALNYYNKGLSIEAGGRLNYHSEYDLHSAFNINPSYLIDKVKLFGNISSGYKTPSLFQLFSNYGNRDLQPENSLNIEGGFQYFGKNEKTSIRALYFSRKVKDVIAFFFDPGTFQSRYINQDEQQDHGFEIDGRWKVSEKLQFQALYSFVDGEITTKMNGKDTTYFNLLRRPKSLLNFSAGSQITPALFVQVQLNAVGESRDIWFDPITFQPKDIELDSYLLLNFHAEYSLIGNKLKLFADLRNITDRTYSDIYGYSTAGFNAFGGIKFLIH